MTNPDTLLESEIPALSRIGRGKVRDIYSIDDAHLLLVATDRLSAYDVVLPDPVPGKGQVLTEISNFWFAMMEDLIPNHLTKLRLESIIDDDALRQTLKNRAIIARRLNSPAPAIHVPPAPCGSGMLCPPHWHELSP